MRNTCENESHQVETIRAYRDRFAKTLDRKESRPLVNSLKAAAVLTLGTIALGVMTVVLNARAAENSPDNFSEIKPNNPADRCDDIRKGTPRLFDSEQGFGVTEDGEFFWSSDFENNTEMSTNAKDLIASSTKVPSSIFFQYFPNPAAAVGWSNNPGYCGFISPNR